MTALAREAKHRAFVLQKRTRRGAKRLKFQVATDLFRHMDRVRPYAYDPGRYGQSFLAEDAEPGGPSFFPRRAFVIWAGDNPLSSNRSRNLDQLRQRLGLPVELITPATLDRWLVPGHPLHHSYADLSLIHRSDYLRGYLMHHHGGAYVDIKEPLKSWGPSFEQMDRDPAAWVTSFRTSDANWIGKLRGPMGRDILVRYRLMFGKSGFMMRSHTPLTAGWIARMNAVLDERGAELARHPGGVFGDVDDYPLSWTDLLGRVLDPLTLKHHQHVRYDDRMLLRFEDYR